MYIRVRLILHPDGLRENESANSDSPFLMNSNNNDRTLPFEILSEIFSHLASDGLLQLRRVLFFARSWYNAAIYSPKLWATIFIDCEFYSVYRDGRLGREETFIRCCFIRSRDPP